MNSVSQYDGWQTLETVHSVNICDRSYELLNVGGLALIGLILGLIWLQPYTSQKYLCLKAKRRMGTMAKMATQ